MAFLEVKNITKSFGKTQVLKDVGFEMEKGEIVAMLGSSGGGKTTLLRCLNFLETPDSGMICVDGKQVFPAVNTLKGSGKANLAFGMVFQSFNLFPQYTALQNVTLAMNVKSERELQAQGVGFLDRKKQMREKKAENEKIAMDFLARVGLSEKMGNYPCELSGGQCQRVAIARALALSPDILCFDEPTSALDPELTGEVLKVIKDLGKDGRTMIIVTHEMEFARSVADKILFIADGEIAECGTPEEVFDSPKTEKLKTFLNKDKGI